MENMNREFQTVIEVGHKSQTLHFYHKNEHIGFIEYHIREQDIHIDLIFVHQYLEGHKFEPNLLQYFIEQVALRLHLPITGICISEASIHLFYTMKKHYPTLIKDMQIVCEKCICHYCKNQIKSLDHLEITDLYYKHKKGKCPSYQEELLMLGLYTGSERMKENRSRIYHRSHCEEHPSDRRTRRQKNQYYKELYDDIDSIKRQKEREKRQRRQERKEVRYSHFIQKKTRIKKITAEEYAQLLLQQLGY